MRACTHTVNGARNLTSAALLLFAIPLLITSVFEVTGQLNGPNLLGAVAFTLAGQLVVLSAGFLASPRDREIGVMRAIAYIFFLLQTVALPSSLIILAYTKIKGVALESEVKTLIWLLVGSSSAFVLVVLLPKPWHLLKSRSA
jgi:hypothetical protein